MSTNIIDSVRVRGNQDRNTINRILAQIQDLSSADAEDEAIEKRIAISNATRKRTNSIGQEGAPNEVLTSGPRDRRTEAIQLEMPTSCDSYPLTHTTTGTLSFDASSGETKFGSGCKYDGSSYIITDNHANLNITDALTVACWLNIPTGSAAKVWFCKGSITTPPYMFQTRGVLDTLRWTIHDSGSTVYTKDYVYTPSTWFSTVFTFSGANTRMRLYIDGSQNGGDVTAGADLLTDSEDLGIGASGTAQLPVMNNFKMAWLTILNEEVDSTWVTNYNTGHIDLSGGNLITCIPFVGDESSQAEAFTNYCVSS